jgi:uncharacterized lipoprotein YajG
MFKPVLATLVAVTLLAGCANQRFNVAGELSPTPTAKSEDSQAFFVNGIGQKQTVDAAKVCGGAAKVEGVAVEQSGMDVLLGVVTFGIYTPRTARVYCK